MCVHIPACKITAFFAHMQARADFFDFFIFFVLSNLHISLKSCKFAHNLCANETATPFGCCDEFCGGDQKLGVNGRNLSANDAMLLREYVPEKPSAERRHSNFEFESFSRHHSGGGYHGDAVE